MLSAHEASVITEESTELRKVQRLKEEKKTIEARILQAAKLGLREIVLMELSQEVLKLLNENNYKCTVGPDGFSVSWGYESSPPQQPKRSLILRKQTREFLIRWYAWWVTGYC